MKPRFSYSSISTFLGCRRRYYWAYIEGLRPKDRPVYLTVGLATHALRDRWIKGEIQAPVSADETRKIITEMSGGVLIDGADEVTSEVTSLINAYVDHVGDDKSFKFVSPEVEMELDLGDFLIYTRLDALAVDSRRRLYRSELKTAARMGSNYIESLALGLQTGIALWVAENATGKRVAGSVLDVIVKTRTPRVERVVAPYDRWLVEYTRLVVNGVANDIRSSGSDFEKYYPSLNCRRGVSVCPYLVLCRNDSKSNRELYFEKQEKGGDAAKNAAKREKTG